MAEYQLNAVVLGPKSGSDREYTFTIDRDPDTIPADEVVERFMDYLNEKDELPHSNSYELNSAIRSKEQDVVMCLGTLYFSNEKMPFASMISW